MELSNLQKNILKLKLVPNIGNKKLIEIFDNIDGNNGEIHLNDFKNFLEPKQLESIRSLKEDYIKNRLSQLIDNLEKNNIQIITYYDSRYPSQLKKIYSPPALFFVKGDIDYEYNRSIAIVGTRSYTDYGQIQCEKFVKDLAPYKFVIISGLAYGIDSIALSSGLKNKLKCIAVIGSGFDYIYPSSSKKLYKDIIDNNGCIITEYFPWEEPRRGFFPARNRIIAGLARSTLVVEAALKSGSLITAQLAFEEGRDVYALPADITREKSQGCNEIIKRNIAKLVNNPSCIVEDYGFANPNDVNFSSLQFESIANEDHRKILQILSTESLTTNELIQKTQKNVDELNIILTELEILSLIQKGLDDKWNIILN